MASVSGSRLTFFSPGNSGSNNNIVLTTNGTGIAAPVAGKFNIEVFTSAAGALATGFDASAFIQGAVTVAGGAIQAGTLGSTEQLLAGTYGVIDATGKESIQIIGNAATTVTGGSSSITVVGSSGDTITGSSVSGNSQLIDASGTHPLVVAGPMTVTGGAGNTTVWGGKSGNITGGAGVMIVDGSRGGNTITGGAGQFIVIGATSTVAGTAGNKITGGAGDINIVAGNGDTIQGGSGNLTVAVLGKNDSITGGNGGTTFINDLFGVGGGSSIVGGNGASNITVGGVDQGANTMIFAAAGDKVTVGGGLTYVDASQGTITVQGGNSTVVGGPLGAGGFNTNILGGKGDQITLGSAPTYVNALAGTQTIIGGAGAAHIDAGAATTVQGGAGGLEVDGGPAFAGSAQIIGGAGNLSVFAIGKGDTIAGGTGANSINDAYGGGGNSNITGGNGTVVGTGGVNTLVIGAVGDTIIGGTGTMSVNGIAGSMVIGVQGGNTTVQGGTGDTIIGAGAGTLQGFFNANTGAETVNLSPGHGIASLRDVSAAGTAATKVSVTGFVAASDVIQSKTSVNATNVFQGTSAADGAGTGTVLNFLDGSTMTIVGVGAGSTAGFKFTQ